MFKCNKCWYTNTKKLWKCPWCWEFWTFEEDKYSQNITSKKWNRQKLTWSEILSSNEQKNIIFYNIWNKELKRVFQRWIKAWWIYLLGWEPGIWKSTIILQIISELITLNNDIKIWYFSWEENIDQIVDRQKRISKQEFDNNNISIYNSTSLEDIILTCEINKFDIVIFDSIQTIYSENVESVAWSANQIRYCSEKISEFCKKNIISWIVIWHVTKMWEIAWPKYLEHIVDVVLYLEWERFGNYRFLRSYKNRFWTTDDVGIFEMTLFWLQPVYDLKERIINMANVTIPWNVLTIWIDNWRPVVVNLEVLLNKTKYKFPQRTTIWIDSNRLNLIIAILERYLNINLWFFDIYVNIPWEFQFYDSWLDLAIAAWIYSQYKNIVIPKDNVFIWELWLGWQILESKLHNKRCKELSEGFEIIDKNKIRNIIELKNII